MSDFADLTKTLQALSSAASPQNMRQVNKKASQKLRAANAERIRGNITPDLSPMAPRAIPKPFKPQTKARFLYPDGGNGKARLVLLSAWTFKGALIIGNDEKRGGAQRHFTRSKIIRWLPNLRPELADNAAGEFKDKEAYPRKGKMFKKLPKPKFFGIKSDAISFRAGFFKNEKIANIANIQHYGAKNLPARPLLGFNRKDEDAILEAYSDGLKF